MTNYSVLILLLLFYLLNDELVESSAIPLAPNAPLGLVESGACLSPIGSGQIRSEEPAE